MKTPPPTERPMFPIGVVTLAIQDGKLLLGKRKNTYGDGMWGLPGGHLEEGEDMTEAARRELSEETGVTAKTMTFQTLFNQTKRVDGHPYVHVSFLAEGLMGQPENRESDKCSELDWFPLNSLPSPLLLSHAEIIQAFKDGKHFKE